MLSVALQVSGVPLAPVYAATAGWLLFKGFATGS
jgi:hypothetical protein